MRFLDYLLQTPLVHDPAEKRYVNPADFGIGMDTECFVLDNVYAQLVEGIIDYGDGTSRTSYTPIGKELLRFHTNTDGSATYVVSKYCGIVPPYNNVMFEYKFDAVPVKKEYPQGSPGYWKDSDTIYEGVLVRSGSALDSEEHNWFGEQNPGHINMVMQEFWMLTDGKINNKIIGLDSFAVVSCDNEGNLLQYKSFPRRSPEEVEANSDAGTNNRVFLIALAGMMLLGTKVAESQKSPTPVISRQQRRYYERHPDRHPLVSEVRFHTLNVDRLKSHAESQGDLSKDGGWKVAWHTVRQHLRHLKNGKVVIVKAHCKGDPRKALVLKNYNIRMETGEKKPG